jgi:anti-sigma factor RsiW
MSVDNQYIEQQLWDYIDGNVPSEQRQAIEQAIAADPAWQVAYQELTTFDGYMKTNATAEQPSLRFTKNVMEQIATQPVSVPLKNYVNPMVVRGIAAFFALPILIIALYTLASVNWTLPAGIGAKYSLSNISLPSVLSVDTAWYIIGLNVLLALVLLELLMKHRRRGSHS